ncbi:hypothetical protein [Armatimonas sp.]|uniref:hypothetical protein n=1 Tax=Armatimonas sp. TaxID=1872638 RepID=UPI00286C29A0|nr:hypothetical protein [Armatimonas sp.]
MSTLHATLDELLTTASAGHVAAKFSEGLHRRSGNTKGTELAGEASEALRIVCCGLEVLGATDKSQTAVAKPVNPLAEFSRVEASRSQAMALREALEGCLQPAEDLDIARGNVLAESVNGWRGTEWNDRLVQMISEIELELYGPASTVTGGRE